MGDDLPDYELGINVLKQALATLTANVNQLATVEIDVVAQSLSDLTAVVTATALDIRALDPLDLAHEPLPYNYKALTWFLAATCDDGGTQDKGWNVNDWGAGKDFYPIAISFSFGWQSIFTNNIFINRDQGVRIDLIEALAGAGDDPVLLRENITPFSHPLVKKGSGYYAVGSFNLPKNKIDVGNSLVIRLSNDSGGDLGAGSIEITVMGMAV